MADCQKCGGEAVTVFQGHWHVCPACKGSGQQRPSSAVAVERIRTEDHARFRANGGQTQRAAGESLHGSDLTKLQRIVMEAVLDLHRRLCRGANASEVRAWMESKGVPVIDTNSVGSRFNELREKEYLRQQGERPGVSKRMQQVFVPTEKGREWMADRSAA